ncbi:MAG: cysteine--tRNA ligase [Nanoarchaeota archaeon]
MALKVVNTLTRKKEAFKSKGKTIEMYVCGPTVYGPGHLGHARTYSSYDIIKRYLEFSNYNVKLIMNITDVHDDMISQAKKEGISMKKLGEKYTKEFFNELKDLNIEKASEYPKVSEHIKEIIDLIKKLEKNGLAYATDDGVYFRVSKFKPYGKLSKIKIDKEKTGTRVRTDKYEKETVQDFALWKLDDGDEFWNSPWGRGRPGWHIECSAMSMKQLGESFDIHGGAKDLIFPHHENEIAQSEGATKKNFVNYWLHAGLITINGQKMSKSLGNFTTIPQILNKYNTNTLRYFFSQSHYQSPLDYNDKVLQESKIASDRLQDFVLRAKESKGKNNATFESEIKKIKQNFINAMDDNFNTPVAWAELYRLVSLMNKNLNKINVKSGLKVFLELTNTFGLEFSLKVNNLDSEIKKLIVEREKARKNKDFKTADSIRDKLRQRGIILEDTPSGVRWKQQ